MKLKITVHGVAYVVDVEILDPGEGFPDMGHHIKPRRKDASDAKSHSTASPPVMSHNASATDPPPTNGGSVTSPIAGTVIELKAKVGEAVNKDQVLLVIEAMKMKTSIAAPTAGTVKNIPVAVGDTVRENQVLVEFE